MKRKISTVVIASVFIFVAFSSLCSVFGDTIDRDPSGDGHELDWTPKGAGLHWIEVDDGNGTHDDDATYVSVTSGNQEDYWKLGNYPPSGAITNVRLSLRVKHDGGAGKEEFAFALANESTSSEYVGSDVVTDTSWTTYIEDHSTNPVTAGDWYWGDIDLLELGIKSRAIGGYTGTGMCTSGWITITYTAPSTSLTVTLRKSDNQQERIGVGYWGNVSFDAADTNVYSSNYVRAQCNSCDGVDDAFWVNWSTTVWTSTSSSETIPIDNNFRFYYSEHTGAGECPDDGGWSWSDSGIDADGDYKITFANSGTTYVWVQFRIEDIASDDTLSAGIDYFSNAYTVELDR